MTQLTYAMSVVAWTSGAISRWQDVGRDIYHCLQLVLCLQKWAGAGWQKEKSWEEEFMKLLFQEPQSESQ